MNQPPPIHPLPHPHPWLLAEEMPRVENIVTEDDTPVDNWQSERQMRLLVEPLYASWAGPGDGRPFLAAANVGVFFSVHQPPLVPDMFLSLDVSPPEDYRQKEHRSYFVWEFGKPPDVVVEVVSNTEGREDDEKLRGYARMGIQHYAIFDPAGYLSKEPLRLFIRNESGRYVRTDNTWLPVGLGLTVWNGQYEDLPGPWLRWCGKDGALIPTGAERADAANRSLQTERQRADAERQRAETERQRAARLAEKLRAAGIDPDA